MHTYKMQNMSAEHNYCYYSLFLSFTCHCDSHPTIYQRSDCTGLPVGCCRSWKGLFRTWQMLAGYNMLHIRMDTCAAVYC